MRGRRNLRFTQQFARGQNSSNALAQSSESGRKGALVQTLNVELRRRRFTKMKVEHRSARHVQVTLRCATSAFHWTAKNSLLVVISVERSGALQRLSRIENARPRAGYYAAAEIDTSTWSEHKLGCSECPRHSPPTPRSLAGAANLVAAFGRARP